MDGNWIFFLELIIFNGAILAFAFWELYKLRRDKRKAQEEKDKNEKNDDPS